MVTRTLDTGRIAPAPKHSGRGRRSIRIGGRAALVVLWSCVAGIHPGLALEPQTAAPEQPGAPKTTTATTRQEKPKTKVVVPFEMLPTNHMLVQARINDKGPFRLIFDLGAPVTLLNNRVSEAAGVVKPNAPRSFLFGMRGEAEVAKLQIGELTTEKLPVIVFDHPVLSGSRGRHETSDRRAHGLHVLCALQDGDRLPCP